MISDRQVKAGWDFIYLGANIDAEKEAETIGVAKEKAVTYSNTPTGVRANYNAIADYMEEAVDGQDENRARWKDQVEKGETK